MGEVAELLKRAKGLIEDESRWCTGVVAQDESKCEVDTHSPAACRFCALGAYERAIWEAGLTWQDGSRKLLRQAALRKLSEADLSELDYELAAQAIVNDHLGHAAVMAMYDQAIAEAERMGV